MSVPKNRRKKSRFEVFHNMAELQKLLVKDLMVDFGITKMELLDARNSFRSWLYNYDKLLSYRTKNNMIALYNELFPQHSE